MNLEQLYNESFALSDGEILSFYFDYSQLNDNLFLPNTAIIKISARQILKRRKYRICKLVMTLTNVVEIRIFDEGDNGNYSDITIIKQDNGTYYVSFDPYGNTNTPHENDNFVIIAHTLDISEILD